MKLPPAAEIERQVLAMPQIREGVAEVAQQVEFEATLLASSRAFDEGDYAAGIERVPAFGPGAIIRAQDRKSKWLEEGTGIYGPERTPIRPKRGQFLVFRLGGPGHPKSSQRPRRTSGPKRPGDLVFAREVRGRPASWVMRDASRIVAARFGLRWRNLRAFRG